MRRYDRFWCIDHRLGLLAGHRLVVEVGDQHGSCLYVHHAIAARFNLFESRSVKSDGGLRRPSDGHVTGLGGGAALDLTVEGHATVLRVDGAVVSQ